MHVLGLSRFMAAAASVSARQVLLDSDPGVVDRGAGARVQQEEQANGFLWTDAFLPSRHAAYSSFRNGDSPPALCAWRDRRDHIRPDARTAGAFHRTDPAV